jgi:hypothetical protein
MFNYHRVALVTIIDNISSICIDGQIYRVLQCMVSEYEISIRMTLVVRKLYDAESNGVAASSDCIGRKHTYVIRGS